MISMVLVRMDSPTNSFSSAFTDTSLGYMTNQAVMTCVSTELAGALHYGRYLQDS